MNSLQGHLLVSTPQLVDPNFYRTVVLLIRHSDEGALGVVLNRPSGKTVKDLWHQISDEPCYSTRQINVGGPVPGPVMAIHDNVQLAELEITPNIFYAAGQEYVDKLVRQQGPNIKLFVGNAGWGGGQLESEIEQGAWLTTPATNNYVFDEDTTTLWKRIAGHIGSEMLLSILKIDDVPEDPSLN